MLRECEGARMVCGMDDAVVVVSTGHVDGTCG